MKRFFLLLAAVFTAVIGFAQSLVIRDSLKMIDNVTADVMYNNEFGGFYNPDIDDPFPYSVIRMKLDGDVKQAKSILSLDLGIFYTVEAKIVHKDNMILFLVPSCVRNIYVQCGDGCKPQLLFYGSLLSNMVYICHIEYKTAESVSVASNEEIMREIEELRKQNEQMQKLLDLSQSQQKKVSNEKTKKEKNIANQVKQNADSGDIRTKDVKTSQNIIKKHYELSKVNDTLIITIGNSTFKMIKIGAGSFTMGSLFESMDSKDERILHDVTISKDYYLGQTEVTQGLWNELMSNNPSEFVGDYHPVENVSWYNCQLFIRKLNELTGLKFRMPTEAEWEFAARGGIKSNGYLYSGSDKIDDVAWYLLHWGTHKVMQKQPNELGLYDMSGNVWEFCSDWYDKTYEIKSVTNPTGSETGSSKVSRGGAWFNDRDHCRVTYRNFNHPHQHANGLGFRLVLDVAE